MRVEIGANPIDRLSAARIAPRCTATSKRSGLRCEAPAVKGWTVCRCHGARGGAPRGKRNGSFRHGLYTGEAVMARREVRELYTAAWEVLARL
jgi:hypothetical protein